MLELLCDLVHLLGIPGTFILLTHFVDQLKYSTLGGHLTMNREVLLAPGWNGTLMERTFELADSQYLPFLSIRDLLSRFLVTVSVESQPHLILILPRHLV